MNKTTVGDCVAILGSKWAAENGIRACEDMAQPARKEWADLAKRVVEAKKSIAESKEIIKESEAKQAPAPPKSVKFIY